MKWHWGRLVTPNELEVGKSAMLTNMIAGNALAIPSWRYSVIGCIVYALLRIAGYCVRHPIHRNSICDDRDLPTYLYFTPTCENALSQIQINYPGNVIGFVGRICHNLPLRKIFAGALVIFRAPLIWRWIMSEPLWRPWISDVIFYILTKRWGSVRFATYAQLTLIYSNDHCCFDRGIADASLEWGHTTVYIQHAAVTDIFPPLSSTYALLDGQNSLDVYRHIQGSKSTVLICGRQYEIAAIRDYRTFSKSALICASTIDTLENWRPIITAVQKCGYKLTLRTHPSERKKESWRKLAQELGAKWQNPAETSLVDALKQSSVVLAGQSGVLLESALSGAISILVQFPDDTKRGLDDYFGFGSVGLAFVAAPNDIPQVFKSISNGEQIVTQSSASYFDIAYGLKENMQLQAIKAILNNYADATGLANAWRSVRISDGGLKVFFPRDT
jgi:hypothetical protein